MGGGGDGGRGGGGGGRVGFDEAAGGLGVGDESGTELEAVAAAGGLCVGFESGAELEGPVEDLGRPAWSVCLRFGARFFVSSIAVVRFSVETDATDQASRSRATETPAHSVTDVTFGWHPSLAAPIQTAEFLSLQKDVRNSASESQL